MKTYGWFLLLIVVTSCQDPENTTSSSASFNKKKETEKINEVMDNWHRAAAESNFDNYFNLMDTHSIFIGTDASENWSKDAFMEFSKPYFDKGEAWSFQALDRNVYFSQNGDIAWFDEILDTWMGICRGSGVLEQENNDWKIKHYVLSVTVPNENMDSIIKVKETLDTQILEKLK